MLGVDKREFWWILEEALKSIFPALCAEQDAEQLSDHSDDEEMLLDDARKTLQHNKNGRLEPTGNLPTGNLNLFGYRSYQIMKSNV
uniref:Uncharacterized protein n=1 Tax=Romanomermis culicivorax TaxID=13658 RepID=A0A915JQR9_ROMCU